MVTEMQPVKKENLNIGHRLRLLKRFGDNGIAALADYEILELLLTFVIPRGDVKPIAKNLVKKYVTVNAAINAAPAELLTIDGMGERSALLFTFTKELLSYCLKEKCLDRPIITSRLDVEEYLRFYFGSKRDEYLAVIFMDSGKRVVASDIMAEGTVNQCAVYPRSIIERALKYGAVSFILVHNHPGGSRMPSEEDWQITHKMYKISRLLDIQLLDHIIIADRTACSLREMPEWLRMEKE